MGQADELPVVNGVLSQTSDADTHAVLIIHIQCYLRTVVLLQILDKLLRCTGQLQLLGKSLECTQLFNQLLLGGFLFKLYKYCGSVTVSYRNTHALAGDDR